MMAPKKEGSKKQDSANEFYVGLLESELMQRELLEARKNALVVLKRIEKAVLLREQRMYIEAELRSVVGTLSEEISKVMSQLPDMPVEKPKKAEAPKAEKKEEPKPPEPKQLSELDRKLAEIDKRLADLG